MVHIKKLELKGFKSFNKRQEIEFNKCLEAIIGPNGSGKSNILDGITFALGKLSSKDMRAEDFSNLVFHGGKGVKPAKKAKVKLVFENSNNELPIDTEEVTITRSVGEDGRSTYRLNGDRTTRTRILDLLSYAKIKPEGYNIINQGQVSRFVKLSTEERRDILKDLSGVGKYEKKRGRALKELEEVKKREEKAQILLEEKEKRLEEIKKEKERAEEYLKVKNNLSKERANLIKKKIEDKRQKEEKLEKEIKRKSKKIEELKKEKKEIKEEIKDIKGGIKKIKERRKDVEKDKSSILTKIQQKREKSKKLSGIRSSKEEESEKSKQKIEKSKKYIERVKKDIKNKKEKREELREKLETKKAKLEEKDAKVEKAENLQERIEEINDKLFQLQVDKEKAKEREDKIKEIKENKKELKEKKERIKELIREIKELKNGLDALNEDLKSKRAELRENKEKLIRLKSKRRSISNFRKKGVKRIKKLAEKGRIEGVKGTVAELGEIDDKYSLALRVAASGRLNNIVVEDEEVASKCIKALKRSKSGVATFLPMNKIKGYSKSPSKFKNKEGAIDFAINLLDFDEEYRNIFSYVLSPTLVVEDLEAAKNIGIGKVRMVTLEGDLISKGGSMTGGSREKKKDFALGFKEKDLRDKINERKTNISVLKEDINHIKERIKIKRDKLTDKKEKRARLESKVENLEEKVSEEIEEGPDLEEIKEKEERLKKEKRNKKEELRDLEFSAFKEKREKLNKLELKLQEINTAIEMKEEELEESKKRLNRAKEGIDELKDGIERINEKLESEEELISSLQKEKNDILERYNKISRELERKGEEKEERIKKKKEIEEKIDTLKDSKNRNLVNKKEIGTKLENLKERLDEISVEIDEEKQKSLDELEKRVRKLKNRLDKFGKVNMKAIDRFEGIEEEFKDLKSKFEKIREEKEEVTGMIEKIDKKKREVFLSTFKEIQENFSRVFKKLTGDGKAELILENEERPLEDGVEMKVKPSKKKKFTFLEALSGGEKALTTLSFIFAIQEYEPAPFYVLDEIDATLDKENSDRLARLLKNYASDSQFILITHNDSVIKRADNLFGVAMNEKGESRIYSINLSERQ